METTGEQMAKIFESKQLDHIVYKGNEENITQDSLEYDSVTEPDSTNDLDSSEKHSFPDVERYKILLEIQLTEKKYCTFSILTVKLFKANKNYGT